MLPAAARQRAFPAGSRGSTARACALRASQTPSASRRRRFRAAGSSGAVAASAAARSRGCRPKRKPSSSAARTAGSSDPVRGLSSSRTSQRRGSGGVCEQQPGSERDGTPQQRQQPARTEQGLQAGGRSCCGLAASAAQPELQQALLRPSVRSAAPLRFLAGPAAEQRFWEACEGREDSVAAAASSAAAARSLATQSLLEQSSEAGAAAEPNGLLGTSSSLASPFPLDAGSSLEAKPAPTLCKAAPGCRSPAGLRGGTPSSACAAGASAALLRRRSERPCRRCLLFWPLLRSFSSASSVCLASFLTVSSAEAAVAGVSSEAEEDSKATEDGELPPPPEALQR